MKLFVAVLVVGCGGAQPAAPLSATAPQPTCKQAIDHIAVLAPAADAQRTREQADVLVKHCNADGWSDATIRCFRDAATSDAAKQCAGSLTQAQLLALADTRDDPRATAAIAVKTYAFEAYPQWAVQHPDRACPGALAELREFTSFDSDLDPWGHPYRLLCGPSLPPAAKGVAIESAGPDGEFDTADDVHSWE